MDWIQTCPVNVCAGAQARRYEDPGGAGHPPHPCLTEAFQAFFGLFLVERIVEIHALCRGHHSLVERSRFLLFARVGIDAGQVQLVRDAGRFGHALRFTKKKSPMPFYRALKNVPYRTNNWDGTVSFWLSTDPIGELEPGFCDPIQITPRAWNDAGFFVEFEKRTNNIPFRLGVYADFKVWNPGNKKWQDVAQSEKSLAEVSSPPFARGKWTHVVFTFENFNTGRDDGVAKLYLDGTHATTLSARKQTFTWDEEKCLIALGLSYIGLWDELAVFNRALTTAEVQQLHRLNNGVRDLHAH